MKTIKLLGLLIVATLSLSIASTASASAAEASFLASETGTIISKDVDTQTFTTAPGGATVACTTAAGTGTVTAKMIEEQKAGTDPLSLLLSIALSTCPVYIGSVKVATGTVSLAPILLHANGSVFIEESIFNHGPPGHWLGMLDYDHYAITRQRC